MNRTLIRNAHVLTMDDQLTEYDRADILIEGTKIKAIDPDFQVNVDEPGLRVINAESKLAMPGLVNGHIHSPGNLMKGAVDTRPLEIYTLDEAPP